MDQYETNQYEPSLEPGVRFGCGAFLGAMIGGIVALIWQPDSFFIALVLLVLPLLLFGLLSMKTGDPFWARLADLWPWH